MHILWTDGSASPNPGPGGYAVIEQFPGETSPDTSARPVRIGRERHSSNIRMEGAALIAAMEYAGSAGAKIYTDSQFWINVLTQWAPAWQAKGWVKKSGEIKNLPLVKLAWQLYNQAPIELIWVRGHVGTALNEQADQLANRARQGFTLPEESALLKPLLD